jgi:DNA-binding transcriptional ArsR family regulator
MARLYSFIFAQAAPPYKSLEMIAPASAVFTDFGSDWVREPGSSRLPVPTRRPFPCPNLAESWEAKMGLTYSHIGMYCSGMARAATTSDAFNAVAEPRRRDILAFLALDERPVSDIVHSLGIEQPSVSKHLRVLRDVGLVHVRRDGRRMLYRTNADAIRPLYEWTSAFERFWRHQLSRLKDRAEAKADGGSGTDQNSQRRRNNDVDPSRN